jgi:integrase
VDGKLRASVVPHTLRHTAITGLMQAGVPIEEVSGFAGVSTEALQRTYWHHSPEFQDGVGATRMGNRAHSRAQTAL